MRRLSYENMYKWVRSVRNLRAALTLLDRAAVAFVAVSYVFLLVFSYIGGGWQKALTYLAVSAVPFVILSLVRGAINAPRPAELFDIDALGITTGGKRGESMPSRHVFSAFLIGTLLTYEVIPLGAVVLVLGVCIGACRVLCAKHFVRDCVAGALCGAICGIIGILILMF